MKILMQWVMAAVFVAVLVVALVLMSSAQSAPKLPEASKTKLLSLYKSAVIAQTNAALAQQKFQATLAAYNALAEKTVLEEKLPSGSQFQVNVDTDEVTVVLPKAEKK